MLYSELARILMSDFPSEELRKRREELGVLIPEFKHSFNFDQKNIWHPYDVFEHTLRVVDGVGNNNFYLRIAALFHDIGKPYKMTIDENGQGHFYGHWNKSKEIFIRHSDNFYVGKSSLGLICDLIEYHDLSINKDNVREFMKIFSEDEMDLLFLLKKSDILAQNEEFIMDRLDDLEKQKDLYYDTLDEYRKNKKYK